MNRIIKFGASWCGPCNSMKPHFEEFQKNVKNEGVEIMDIDVDIDYETSEKYGIQSVPTTVFIRDGEVKEFLRGMQTASQLTSTFKKVYENQ